MSLFLTAAQTTGPFVAISFERTLVDNVAPLGVSGERCVIQGRVLDGNGKPVDDAVIETWQANSHGKYPHPEDTRQDEVAEFVDHHEGAEGQHREDDVHGAHHNTSARPAAPAGRRLPRTVTPWTHSPGV